MYGSNYTRYLDFFFCLTGIFILVVTCSKLCEGYKVLDISAALVDRTLFTDLVVEGLNFQFCAKKNKLADFHLER